MRLHLLHDHVLVRPEPLPEKLGDLFVVYDRQSSTMFGHVVAVGEGPVTSKGVRLPHEVRVGSRVVFSPDSGTELTFEHETLICLREWDVLAEIL